MAAKAAEFKASNLHVDILDVTANGRWALSGATASYNLWDLQNASEQRPVHRWEHVRVNGPHYHQRVGAISPDGSRVLLTTQANPPALILIDAASGDPVQEFLGHAGSAVNAVAISPDGRLAVSGGLDGKVMLWRLPEQIDSERRAADWVLKIGGSLQTRTSTPEQKILSDPADLPGGSIECVSVAFMNNPRVTNEGLQNLSGLRNLQELRLVGTPVTDEGLKHLKGLPKLTYLNLDGTQVGDAGIAHLAGLTNLRHLSLQNTQVTGRAFPEMIAFQHLDILVLTGTSITDEQIPYLTGLPELEDLYLGRTQITDGCVPHLARLKQLRLFDYKGSKMTDAGARELKKAKPSLLLLPDK